MKRFVNMLFVDERGKISITVLFAVFALVVAVHLYVVGFWLQNSITAEWLNYSIALLELAIVGRAGQRGLQYIGDGIANIRQKDKTPAPVKPDPAAPTKNDHAKQAVANQVPPSNHFSIEEFASKDGAPMPPDVRANVLVLMEQLNIIRDELGVPVVITSGYRSPEHNRAVGGAKNSYHTRGMAADIAARGYVPTYVHAVIKRLMDQGKIKQGGLKQYKTFVHYDIRGKYATW